MTITPIDPVNVPPVKPGWATTEWWATIAFSILTLLAGLGVIGPDFAKAHAGEVNAVCLGVAGLAPVVYAIARALVKRAHQQAVAQVLASHGPVTAPLTLRSSDGGLAVVGLIGLVLLVIGAILLIVDGLQSHVISIPGIVLLLLGLVVLAVDSPRARRYW